jgi:hypothetical protein
MDRGSPAYVYFTVARRADAVRALARRRISSSTRPSCAPAWGRIIRYAEHLSAALREFFHQVPEARDWVVEGTAEPE